MEERFMKHSKPVPKKKDFLQILREYELYDKDHIYTHHRNSKRNAKYSGYKNLFEVSVLAVKVKDAISVLFGKIQLSIKFFIFVLFLPKSQNCVNVKMLVQLVAKEGINQHKIDNFFCALLALTLFRMGIFGAAHE